MNANGEGLQDSTPAGLCVRQGQICPIGRSVTAKPLSFRLAQNRVFVCRKIFDADRWATDGEAVQCPLFLHREGGTDLDISLNAERNGADKEIARSGPQSGEAGVEPGDGFRCPIQAEESMGVWMVAFVMLVSSLLIAWGGAQEFRYFGPGTPQFLAGLIATPAGLLGAAGAIVLGLRRSRRIVIASALALLVGTLAATALDVMGPMATLLGLVGSIPALLVSRSNRPFLA